MKTINLYLNPSFRSAVATLLLVPALTIGGIGLLQADEGTPADNRDAVMEQLNTMGEAMSGYNADQKDEAVANADESLSSFDREFSDLQVWTEKNWENLKDSSKETQQAAMENLRKARTKVGEWTESLRNSSTETWEDVKVGFTKASDELKEAYNKTIDVIDDEDHDS